jgi:chemotaxis methyl-accepting protein methylase
MNITHRPPSAEALTVLSALQSAVTKNFRKETAFGTLRGRLEEWRSD